MRGPHANLRLRLTLAEYMSVIFETPLLLR